ncbi:MAG: hypothetical protein IPJ88_15715 [Myxococcales bacterium]|nr:MAG: hypothetical protein IPJ88_15715 [Myxococcales bacterium]
MERVFPTPLASYSESFLATLSSELVVEPTNSLSLIPIATQNGFSLSLITTQHEPIYMFDIIVTHEVANPNETQINHDKLQALAPHGFSPDRVELELKYYAAQLTHWPFSHGSGDEESDASGMLTLKYERNWIVPLTSELTESLVADVN